VAEASGLSVTKATGTIAHFSAGAATTSHSARRMLRHRCPTSPTEMFLPATGDDDFLAHRASTYRPDADTRSAVRNHRRGAALRVASFVAV